MSLIKNRKKQSLYEVQKQNGWRLTLMQKTEEKGIELSIVMPCLNEVQTVGFCIKEAKAFFSRNHINGEIIVVDNGSSDNSAAVAGREGVKVIREQNRGYGRAIRTGISHSKGTVILIGDCDMTYDFNHLEKLYEPLIKNQCDMVIGNRYAGGIEKGAMPLSHRLGVRFLSWCGRVSFRSDIYDFHCGLRGITAKAASKMNFCCDGMEFATEMIAQAAVKNMRIGQVPVVLRKCPVSRQSKLRTLRDGWRHLIYMIGFKHRRAG